MCYTRKAVLLGMTRGEWTLVLFVFGLVYSAGLLVRFGEWFGARVFGNDDAGPKRDGRPDGNAREDEH